MEQKERIAKYAFSLFRENGIKSISMAEIAGNLGISKRTLYELFENKEDLLLSSIQYLKKEREQLLARFFVESDNLIEVYLKLLDNNIVEDWNSKFFDDIEKYFHKVWIFLKDFQTEHLEMFDSFLKEGIEDGMFRSDINRAVYSFLFVDLGESYIRALKRPSLPFPVKELAYEMNLNAIRGIATPKGLAVIENYFAKKKS